MEKIISKAIFSFIASIAFINISFCQIHNPITGWLHTSGTLILDANNNAVCLNGINSSGMEWGSGGSWSNGHCDSIQYGCYATPSEQGHSHEYDSIKSWGFNCVRFLISWANLEPTMPTDSSGVIVHHWNQVYLNSLDNIVSRFGSRGIALIMSLHQWTWSPVFHNSISGKNGLGMPVWLYKNQVGITRTEAEKQFFVSDTLILPDYTVQQGYIDAWKIIIGRYANNQTIIGADLFNEPPSQYQYSLKKFYDTVGTAIHTINPNLLLIFQDQEYIPFQLKKCPTIPNAVYSFHMYPSAWLMPDSLPGKALMQAHLDTTQAWNVPMLLGEFAQFGWSDTLGWMADMKMMFDFCKQNHINWTYFSYQDSGRSLIDIHTGLVHDTLVRALNAGMCSSITGIPVKYVAKNIVTIYPNPFNSIINMELPVNNCQLKVFDMLGNNVFEKTLNSKHETLKLTLPKGMYFYQVTDNKINIFSGKIIAE